MPDTARDCPRRAVLFPSRRARLFFVDALTRIAGRPMWQPEWVTDRRPDERNIGPACGRPRAAHHRALQGLLGIPQRAVRQVLFLGRYAPHGLRHDRQVPDRRADALPQHLRNQGDRSRHLLPDARPAAAFCRSGLRWARRPIFRRRNAAFWRSGRRSAPFTANSAERLVSLGIAYNGMVQRAAADRIRRRRVRLSRTAEVCRGGIQRPVGVRKAALQIPCRCRRNRFLLGLRRLL